MKNDTTPRYVTSRYARFTMIPDFVHDAMPKMGPHATVVYLELAWIAGSDPTCYPSIAHIRRATGLADRTVQRAIADLAAMGLISVERRFRANGAQASNYYTLLDVAKPSISDTPPRSSDTPPSASVTPLEPYTVEPETQSEIEYTPHDIVQWWMDRHDMKTIANSVVVHAHAKQLIKAGLQRGEENALYDWLASDDYWKNVPITIAIMYRQYNAWRVAGSPARARSYVPDV